jgi:hypothetical protein
MKVHGKRALLNPPGHHSTAAIVAEISDTGNWKPGCGHDGKPLPPDEAYAAQPFYLMLSISDCDRRINFLFEWETADDRRAGLRKVDTLIDALTAFRHGLVIEQARYVERMQAKR